MAETQEEKTKVSVTRDVKREIDLLAADEQRPVYILVEDMVEIYKRHKTGKKSPVDIADAISRKSDKRNRSNAPIAA
jgi:hypothetical protein